MKRNHALDGLRGLAALAVAGGHSVLAVTGLSVWALTLSDFPDRAANEVLGRLAYIVFPNDAAVMLFFVLSGYVLWEAFSKKYQPSLSELPDYALSRAYRLLPTTIAAGVLFGLAEGRYVPEITTPELIRTMLILSRETNGVLWSLQTEVVCSLGLFLVWLAVRRSSFALMLCLIGSVVAFRYYPDGYVLCSTAFLAGALVRHAPRWICSSKHMAVLGLLMLVGASLFTGHEWRSRYYEMTGAFLIIAYVKDAQPGFLVSRPVHFLGQISYPFYLVHPLAIALVGPAVFSVSGSPEWMRILLFFVASTAVAIPMAWIIHEAVEKPAMQGRPRLSASTFSPRRLVSAARAWRVGGTVPVAS